MARTARRAAAGPDRSEGFERFRSGVTGTWPADDGSGVILAACDAPFYWRFAVTLLLSIEKQAERQRVHLHLCRPDADTLSHVESLKSRLKHVQLTSTWDDGAMAAALPSPGIYYSAARFLIAPLVLAGIRAPLLCVDADGIAIRPVWPAFDAVRGESDVLVFSLPATGKPAPGAVGINPTGRGARFADVLARTMATTLAAGATTHIDQDAIAHVARVLRREGLRLGQMPLGLMDFEFAPGSVIWTPKGHGAKSDDVYQAARQEVARLYPEIARPNRARQPEAIGDRDPTEITPPAARPGKEPISPHVARLIARHGKWIDALGLRHRPWLVLGSAPEPTIPAELAATHARIDINNAGRTAAAMGFGRADLTLRTKKKSWEEHRQLDTRGLIWLHSRSALRLRLILLTKPYHHIGSLMALTLEDRDAIVAAVAGPAILSIGDLGKVTNGIAAACYGLLLGVPEIVLAGISLSKAGHSYDELGRRRRQVDEDAFVLDILRGDPRILTTEADLARDAGVRLWRPSPA